MHSNKHIRAFSADSFSYILKKMQKNERKGAIIHILQSLDNKD